MGASPQDGAGESTGARRRRKTSEENGDAQGAPDRTDRSSFSEIDRIAQIDREETKNGPAH